ncbi:MAG: citramalate synthase [Clostridia bacterium]|nr:citramalate synthase [Clostridia bacterium]
MKIIIEDTTLRDGEQGVGIAFTAEDRVHVITELDELGVGAVETGYYSPDEPELNSRLLSMPCRDKLTAFCGTCRPGERADGDPTLVSLAQSGYRRAALFGKTMKTMVSAVLRAEPEENLRMIRESVKFLSSAGVRVTFDAEHIFDAVKTDPDYAFAALRAAADGGAAELMLCDTIGGSLPGEIAEITKMAVKAFPGVIIGIHCHNDAGLAEACVLAAADAGASAVQGTISGIGERCGNANLNTVIPLLQLKRGYECVPPENLPRLTHTARYISEVANLRFDEREPFVGGYAFRHKAGTHIDATIKLPGSFEHIDPAAVGNSRGMVISGLSGRAAIVSRIKALTGAVPDKNDPRVIGAAARIKQLENEGYVFDAADASLTLVLLEALGTRRRFFEVLKYQITITEGSQSGAVLISPELAAEYEADPTRRAPEFYENNNACSAVVKVRVGGEYRITADEGNGPVNALDLALRKSLRHFYPEIVGMYLTDYKVRVLTTGAATASGVRVLIESSDGSETWRTVGVSSDVVEASCKALSDSIEYFLMQRQSEKGE